MSTTNGNSCIFGSSSQLFLNSKELIVLCHSFTSAGRACFDLAGVQRYRKVGDRCIGGFA